MGIDRVDTSSWDYRDLQVHNFLNLAMENVFLLKFYQLLYLQCHVVTSYVLHLSICTANFSRRTYTLDTEL